MNRREFFKILSGGALTLLLGYKVLDWEDIAPVGKGTVDLGELEPNSFHWSNTAEVSRITYHLEGYPRDTFKAYPDGGTITLYFNGNTIIESDTISEA